MSGKALYVVAGVLLALLLAAIAWLLGQGSGGALGGGGRANGTNPALDVRFRYDPDVLQPAPYDPAAEFPLQLNGDGWSFYGKRLRGVGTLLAKDPGPLLYDFVGSQQNDVFEYWYKLQPAGKPVYEDARLQGRLALHTATVYKRTAQSRGWPPYFPAAVTGDINAGNAADPDEPAPAKGAGDPILDEQTEDQVMRNIAKSGGEDTAYVEGWVLYTDSDLFFFYAISADELSRDQRDAAVDLINSLQFNAVLGEAPASAKPEPVRVPGDKTQIPSLGK